MFFSRLLCCYNTSAVTSLILYGIAVGVRGELYNSSGIGVSFTLRANVSFSWIISSTSSSIYSTLLSNLAICKMVFHVGSPACIDRTLFLGGCANMVTISSAACLRWSLRVTLGNTMS